MQTLDAFVTHDLWLAAYLRAHGVRLTGTTREGARTIFAFADPKRCEDLTFEYRSGGTVEVSRLRSVWQDLKDMVFER